jgi:Cysteine sulfinate desulfinase/cysteine desulfurase and related enzymes
MTSTRNFTYFDHNATTPVCSEVVAALPELATAWGNPSSIHWGGRQPKEILRDTRRTLSDNLNIHPLEIVFTSGGSEASNTVIKGLYEYYKHAEFVSDSQRARDHYMCSIVEHPSIIKTMEHLKTLGAKVDFIPVNLRGELDMEFFKTHLTEKTALVSVMMANNETGTIFPIKELAAMAHAKGAVFHTDAVQAFGKIPVDLSDLGVDFASFSGHKFYSVKGSGFLYVKKGNNVFSLIHGGAQERHRRGGTENTLGIGALGVVAKRLPQVAAKSQEIAKLRDYFEAKVLTEIPEVTITAGETKRLPNTSSLVIKDADGETMLMGLDIKGYAVSTGAACSSGNPEPSPVLLAMGLTRGQAQNSLRVSLGWDTTLEQVDGFIEALKAVVERLRTIKNEEGDSHYV